MIFRVRKEDIITILYFLKLGCAPLAIDQTGEPEIQILCKIRAISSDETDRDFQVIQCSNFAL